MIANTSHAKQLTDNPRAMLEIMEGLDRYGFKANFKFSDGVLELVIRTKYSK
jgi:hypothetical protein